MSAFIVRFAVLVCASITYAVNVIGLALLLWIVVEAAR